MAPNRGTPEANALLNRSSMLPKWFTLLYSAGTTTLIPFLPMYFRQLGMTAFQSGILGSFPVFVEVLVSPAWQLLATRINKRKCFLVLMVLIGIVLNVSVGLIRGEDADPGAYKCEIETTALHGTSNLSEAAQVWNSSENSNVTFREIDRSIRSATFANSGTLQKHRSHNESEQPGELVESSRTPLEDKASNNSYTKVFVMYGFRIDHTFSLLALLLFFGGLLTPVSTIADSMFSDVLYRHTNLNVTHKVWMSLGALCGGAAVTVIVGRYQCSFGLQNSFYLHFYLFALFGAGAFGFASLLQTSESRPQLHGRAGASMCSLLCCDMNFMCFLAVLWVVGIAESLISNYLMWYLQDINTSLVLMGLSMMLMAVSELVMHVVSRYLLHWCGSHWLLFFSLIIYGARFLCFSYITSPALAISMQLLHGFSHTAAMSASKSCAASVSLPGMEGTASKILNFTYLGLGRGLGGITAALLYQLYGPLVIFRCAAGVCGLYSLCFAFLHCILILPNSDRDRGKALVQYQHISLEDDGEEGFHEVDWLLEALEAEELSEFTRWT